MTDPLDYIFAALISPIVLFFVVKAVREIRSEIKHELRAERAEIEHHTLIEDIAFKSQGTLKDAKTTTTSRQGTIFHNQHTMTVNITSEDPGEGTSMLSSEEDPYSFTFKLTALNIEAPAWFSCTIGRKQCTLNMGRYKIDVTKRKKFVNIFPPDIAKRLLKLSKHTTIRIKGDPMRVTLTGQTQLKNKKQEDAFVLQGATFPFVMRDLIKSLPNTSKEMEALFIKRVQDPFMLTQFYVQRMIQRNQIPKARRFIERTLNTSKDHDLLLHLCAMLAKNDTLQWAEDFIQEVIERTADTKLLSKVLSMPSFLRVLTNVNVSTKRAVELLHVMHMTHHDSKDTHALMSQIEPQHLTREVFTDFPHIARQIITHLWATDAPRDDVAQAYDCAAHIMNSDDAAHLLRVFAQDTPELCTYARVDAALQADSASIEREHMYAVMDTLYARDPTRFKEPRWLTYMIEFSDQALKDDVDAILELLTRHAQHVHYQQLHEIATSRLYKRHPLHASLSPVLEAIKSRSSHGGLNLSESTQAGKLTELATQDGGLSIKE